MRGVYKTMQGPKQHHYRIITGFISDRPNVDVIVIQNVAAIVSGVATGLVFLFNSYALMCAYAAVFGVFIGLLLFVHCYLCLIVSF